MRRVRSSSNGQIELNLRFSCAIETMSHQHIILPPQLLPLLLTAAMGIIPMPHVLAYYAIFFFGVFYYECNDQKGRLAMPIKNTCEPVT